MLMSLRSHPRFSAQPARLGASLAHGVRRARHSLAQVSGLRLDEADQGFSSVRPLACKPCEDGGEDTRHPYRHMTLLMGGAPAALECDFSCRRRAGRLARGFARGPILSNSLHDHAGEASNRLPAIAPETGTRVGVPPVSYFPRAGFGRPGAFNRSQRAQSGKIVRASQHSASPNSTCEHPQMNTGLPSDAEENSCKV